MNVLVPLTFIVAVVSLLALALGLRASTRRRAIEVVLEGLRSGAPLDKETVEAITAGRVSAFDDLRRGILFLAFAAAMVAFSFAVRDASVVRGLALFPGFMGASFIGFHLVRLK
ncbi:MAG: hypothetical protein AAF735_07355 [Myxococcota bacterium]